MAAFVSVLLGSSLAAKAEEYVYINGQPCGAFCRWWMGIKLPPKSEQEKPAEPQVEAQPDEDVGQSDDERPGPPRRLSSAQGGPHASAHAAPVHHEPHFATERHREAPFEVAHHGEQSRKIAAAENARSGVAPVLAAARPVVKPTAPAPVLAPLAASEPSVAASRAAPVSATQSAAVGSARPAPTIAKPDSADPVLAKIVEELGRQPIPTPSATPARTEAEPPKPESPVAHATASEAPNSAGSPPDVVEQQTNASSTQQPTATFSPEPAPTPTSVAALNAAAAPNKDATSRDNETARAKPQILVLLVKPEINGAADLNDKTVLNAGVSVTPAQTAASFAAAGASGAKFVEGSKGDIEQLTHGEVAAAIVGVVGAGKSASLQELPGYRTLLLEVPSEPSR